MKGDYTLNQKPQLFYKIFPITESAAADAADATAAADIADATADAATATDAVAAAGGAAVAAAAADVVFLPIWVSTLIILFISFP